MRQVIYFYIYYCPPSFSLRVLLMKTTPLGRRGHFGRSVTLINTELAADSCGGSRRANRRWWAGRGQECGGSAWQKRPCAKIKWQVVGLIRRQAAKMSLPQGTQRKRDGSAENGSAWICCGPWPQLERCARNTRSGFSTCNRISWIYTSKEGFSCTSAFKYIKKSLTWILQESVAPLTGHSCAAVGRAQHSVYFLCSETWHRPWLWGSCTEYFTAPS